MRSQTVITLDNDDWTKLVFRARHICDRIPHDSAHNVLLDGRLTAVRALALIGQHLELLADYEAGKIGQKPLDEIFNGLYYTTETIECGFGHILYLYRNYNEFTKPAPIAYPAK